MNMRVVRAFICLFCFSLSSALFAADVTLDDVKGGYVQSISAMEPVWTRCRFAKTYEVETPAIGRTSFADDTIEWAIDGEKFHFSWLSSNTTLWFASTGKTFWELDFPFAEKGGDPRQTRCARKQNVLTKTDSQLRIFTTPGIWLGLYIPVGEKVQSGESVRSMLQKPSAKLIGTENIDQHPCIRVNLVYRRLDDKEISVDVWFDPSVGFLPRRIELDGNTSTVSYIVDEFEHFEHTSFPSKMRKDHTNKKRPNASSTQTLDLQDISLGKSLEEHLFVPKLEDNIPTFNLDRGKDRLAWQEFLAGETPEVQQARVDALRERAKNRPPPTDVPSDLKPAIEAVPQRFPWTITFLIVGVSLLTLAGIRMRS